MLMQKVKVESIKDQQIQVSCDRVSGCGHCASRQGCSIATLNKVFSPKHYLNLSISELDADFEMDTLNAGEEIVLEYTERSMLQLAFYAYLIPLFGLLFFSVIGTSLVTSLKLNEFFIVIIAFLGFSASLYYSRYLVRGLENLQIKIQITI